jgi:two-component system CheB/CheR fusion protein
MCGSGRIAPGSLVRPRSPRSSRKHRHPVTVRARRSTHAATHRRLLDHVADPVLIFDRTTHRILDCNDAMLRVYGWTRAELRRMTPFDLHPPEDRSLVESTIDVRNYDHAFNYTHVTKDGRRLAVETLSDAGDYGGRPAWITVIRDISARRRAEEALRESESRFRILADSSPVLIWMTGTDGGCTYCNRTLLDFTGWTEEQGLGDGWLAGVHPEDRERIAATYREAFDARRPFSMEYRLRRADGAFRWVLVRGVPRRTATGEFDGYIGSCMDIHDRRALEETMARARDHAEAAARAKTEFLANMSHELRTPMNAVLGMTSLLLDSPLDDEQRDCVETIRTSGTSLLGLIQDILEYSRLESGRAQRETQVFDVRECVEACVELFVDRARARNLELRAEIAPELPARVAADATHLRQILVHLLDNALKFTDVGRIVVRAAAEADGLCLTVSDTGIGIDPDHMQRLFEAFSPGDASLTRNHDGAGIGLALCRRLCDLLGGSIAVESRWGIGSTFTVRVPVRWVTAGRARVAAAAGAAMPSRDLEVAPRRVLLVEDNPVNQRFVMRLLQRLGQRTDVATSGQEALAALVRQPYDLVLMDVSMSDLDGFETTRVLRSMGDLAQPCIVGMSNGTRGDRSRCQSAGMDDCIRKPVRLAALRAVLRRWASVGPAEESPSTHSRRNP